MIDGSTIAIRPARREDVAAIVRMLADDSIGGRRETASGDHAAAYEYAFDRIMSDDCNTLAVAESPHGEVIGCLQLTIIPGLSYRGGTRALIEGVRVDSRFRGRKIGHRLLNWAIDEARRQECFLVQLTTHRSRDAARRFYKDLGFEDSHIGMKLSL